MGIGNRELVIGSGGKDKKIIDKIPVRVFMLMWEKWFCSHEKVLIELNVFISISRARERAFHLWIICVCICEYHCILYIYKWILVIENSEMWKKEKEKLIMEICTSDIM